MITFVLAEANCTFQLGHRRLWRFAVLVLIRTATPVVAALVFATFSANTLTAVIGSIALGNIACLFVFPNSWSIRARAEGISSLDVGIVNFGLWVIASADRMILQLTAEPHVLAVYALSYGLVDRACRSLSNVYISKSIGLPDGGASASKGRVLTLISGVLAIGLVPAVIIGSFVVSGGKYVPDFALGASVSVAGVLMFASAPFYVRMLASGRIRMPAVVVLSIAVLNVALNSLCARSGSVLPAAWISGGSYAIWTVYLAVRFRRRGRHVAVLEVRRSIARIEQRQSS
jgi:O-antigen/teichoic acid export membrane protein